MPETDYEGDPRLICDVVDMGADEAPAPAGGCSEVVFIRGDCNGDQAHNLADAIFTLSFLFAGAEGGTCSDSCDVNDDGLLDIADPIFLLDYLFGMGEEPVYPFPECGPDPPGDPLGCSEYVCP